jgi:hypothetical protein
MEIILLMQTAIVTAMACKTIWAYSTPVPSATFPCYEKFSKYALTSEV